MKSGLFITLISLLFHTLLYGQDSSISGVVSIQNSKYENGRREYILNAQVEDDLDKAPATVTKDKGTFVLAYHKVPEGESVSFTVSSTGYQVVNIDALVAVTGQREKVNIYMARPEKINEYRKHIYRIGSSEAEKNLKKQIADTRLQLANLSKSAATSKQKIAELESKLKDLDDKYKNIDVMALDLAQRYAGINLDDESTEFLKAFDHFQRGELDLAMQTLSKIPFEKRTDLIVAHRSTKKKLQALYQAADSVFQVEYKNAVNTLRLKLDMHYTKYELDSVAKCYKWLIKIDDSNADFLFNYAEVNTKLHKDLTAIDSYNRALNYTKNDSLIAVIKTNLGVLYQQRNDFQKAEKLFNESLDIQKKLFAANASKNRDNLVKTQVSLGELYMTTNNYNKAEQSFHAALNNQGEDGENAEPPNNSYGLYNGLGMLSLYTNDYSGGKDALIRSVEDLRKQLEKKSTEVEPKLVSALCKLANVYLNDDKYEDAKKCLDEADGHLSKLLKLNTDLFQYLNAQFLYSRAFYESKIVSNDKGIPFLKQSLAITAKLAQSDASVYEMVYNNRKQALAYYYNYKGESDRAAAVYDSIHKVYIRYFEKDSTVFGKDLAELQLQMVATETSRKNYKKAIELTDFPIKIFKQLNANAPLTFRIELAEAYYLRANSLFFSGNAASAIENYEAALKVYDQIPEKNASMKSNHVLMRFYYAVTLHSLKRNKDAIMQYKSAAVDQAFLMAGNKQIYLNYYVYIHYNLGSVYENEMDLLQAERELKIALDSQQEQTLVDKRPFLVEILWGLSKVDEMIGKSKLSDDYLEQAITIQRELASEDNIYNAYLVTLLNTAALKAANYKKYDVAAILFDEAINIQKKLVAKELDYSSFYIQILINKANLFKAQNKLDEAEQYLNNALTEQRGLQPKNRDDKQQVLILESIAQFKQQKPDLKGAQIILDDAIKVLKTMDTIQNPVSFLYNRILAEKADLLSNQGFYDEAMRVSNLAISRQHELAKNSPDGNENLATFYVGQGYINVQSKKYQQAIDSYQKAVIIQEELIARNPAFKQYMVNIYRAIANTYLVMPDLTNALNYMDMAIKLQKQLPQNDGNMLTLMNLYLEKNSMKRNASKLFVIHYDVDSAAIVARKLIRTDPVRYKPILFNIYIEKGYNYESEKMYDRASVQYFKADSLMTEYSKIGTVDSLQLFNNTTNRIRVKMMSYQLTAADSLLKPAIKMGQKFYLKNPKYYGPILASYHAWAGEIHRFDIDASPAIDSFLKAETYQAEAAGNDAAYKPYLISIYDMLSDTEVRMSRIDDAIIHINKAIRIHEELALKEKVYVDYLIGLYTRAAGYYMKNNQYEEAITLLEKIIPETEKSATNDVSYIHSLNILRYAYGPALCEAGKVKEAIKVLMPCKEYIEALEKQNKPVISNLPLICYYLGKAYAKDKQKDAARLNYKTAISILKDVPKEYRDEKLYEQVKAEMQKLD